MTDKTDQKPEKIWRPNELAVLDFEKDARIIKKTFNIVLPDNFTNYPLAKLVRKLCDHVNDGHDLNGINRRTDHRWNVYRLLAAAALNYNFKRNLVVGAFKIGQRWLKAPCDNNYLSDKAGIAERTRDNCIATLKEAGYWWSQERREVSMEEGCFVFSGKHSLKRIRLDSIAEQLGAESELFRAQMWDIAKDKKADHVSEVENKRLKQAAQAKRKREALYKQREATRAAKAEQKLTPEQQAQSQEQLERANTLRVKGYSWSKVEQIIKQEFGFVLALIRTADLSPS
ncbi:hypothetical protein F0267_25930 [Vibrio coralliilyticus]|uniref:hypothetical protein n=1 Tax=Vibrio TaxID=662 RepID=UPI00148C0272|nr:MULTISPECIES: hypothetical protein [Vibrio]NOH26209.1 hypothetical protein [Vibrio europaeus]NOH41669.1 hypothetical protein [Vibrio coralliilyticus]